ncbi:MAG: alpha/beta fold hydrolase [Micrococcus sp.]|nr:alpha/beta fold hydrolase [Micrococcus sp.]
MSVPPASSDHPTADTPGAAGTGGAVDTAGAPGASGTPDDSGTSAPRLAATRVGDQPRRIAFLHGLMGRGRNFSGVAQALTDEFTVEMIDLPDHGQSEWTTGVDYQRLADEVAAHLRAGLADAGPVHLIGHSMGGKVAMALALRHPELIERLVVVDIAPRVSPSATGEFEHLLGTMLAMDLSALSTRAEADAVMARDVDDERVRGFLLQNLRREKGHFAWQPNVQMLRENLEEIGGFPDPVVEDDPQRTFERPVLWLGGANSSYIQDEDVPTMKALFPKVMRVTLRGAGHWVHADQPEAFVTALRTFLNAS